MKGINPMKKTLCLLIAFTLLLSLFSFTCSAEGADPAGNPEESEFSAWDELEKLGLLETMDGQQIAVVTMPADFSVGATQQAIDASAGEVYISGKLNDDGSVTYWLTKEQHEAFAAEMAGMIDGALQDIVNSPDYNCTYIQHSEDFRIFDAMISTDKLSNTEVSAAKYMYILGGLYGVFTGHSEDNISVRFFDSNGSYLGTANSEKSK